MPATANLDSPTDCATETPSSCIDLGEINTWRDAEEAIARVLALVPDSALPDFREEVKDGRVTLWYGGMGHVIGECKPDRTVHRSHGIVDALQGEATYREAGRRGLDPTAEDLK